MSLLWRLLTRRAGHSGLPDDIGADPKPEAEDDATPVLELTAKDFARAGAALNLDPAVVRAVAEVEAAGRGFLPDGRPQILFEAHIFHRQTDGRFRDARDRNGVLLSSPRWDRTLYGAAGAAQHERLEDAAALDWKAAHRAASWGLFQILGINHVIVGFSCIRGFVDAMQSGAGAHLDAFVAFVQANRLDRHLRKHDWAAFARGYNGPGFAANRYDQRLAEAHRRFAAGAA